ncbi:hypothetical protein LAZ67_9000077 [Cordylochernes scorpioides]|uniref:Potassium channel domain-containing protein n=1 Tax=Cordylochernes scorpioides TaxID=51811 RepID=A0ABY6KX92_9ARAC|nr:hypothetical protein LAZ67_9000077 [Cordylochernes scorpioides]
MKLSVSGYGNVAPTTTPGRAVCMIYAIIGIPLLLMVLADLGKLFTRAIKVVFFYIRLFYYTGRCRKARRMGRRATAVPVEFIGIALKNLPSPSLRRSKKGSPEATPENPPKEEETDAKVENGTKEKLIRFSDEEVVESKKPNFDIDDEFNLPVSVALILLVAYMMLGALIFTFWERWTFFEAFYFVFISMSTIGFGDFVPEHPMFMMATFIYLLFGLALTSMCINVVQEKLSEIFELAKMRIGTSVGFDLRNVELEGYGGEAADGQGSKSPSRRGSKMDDTKEKSVSPNPSKDASPKETSAKETSPKVKDSDAITPTPQITSDKT